MKLIIEDDEGRKTVVPVVRDEITIGRQDGNTIKLTERNVSRKHARLWKDSGSLLIEDLGSYNGVRVNGDKIAGPTPVKEGDLIEIGDYDLGIQGKLEATPSMPATPKVAPAPAPKPASVSAAPKPTPPSSQPPAPAPQAAAPAPAPAPAPPPAQEPAPSASAGGATAIININKLMAAGAPQVELRDLAKNEMPRLVGLAGQFRGKEFYLMRTEWKIGRTEENDLQLDHQSISRQHGKFVMEPDGWKLYDNKSANGVKVNGEEYAVAPVKPGDTLELGHVKFRFCAPGEKFSPPPEKVEGGAPAAGVKPMPTTAELIAGAQGKGPQAKAAPAAGGKSKLPLIIGGVVVVAVIAVVALKVLGGGNPEEAAAKEAQAAAAKKDWPTASAKCDAAGDKCPEALRKKIEAETAGQQVLTSLESALSKGDGDAAMAILEKCGTESTSACKQVQAKEDAIKAAFAKKHLEAAKAAKGSDPTRCTEEVGKVLAKEPNNAEAQQIQGECSPNKPPPPPAPKKEEVVSQKDRDNNALRLAGSGTQKVKGGDVAGGLADLKGCVAQRPSKDIMSKCLRNLGISYSMAADVANSCKAFKQYLGYCETDCDQIKAAMAKMSCP